MAVLITAVVPGQTQEGYDAAMRTLRPLLEQAKGFIGHGAGMSPVPRPAILLDTSLEHFSGRMF
jgi:hypothetical protein